MNPLTPEDLTPPARTAGRILLVEDNPDDALLVSAYLAQAGIEGEALAQVDRLAEALEALQQTEFDCVLLDLSLPDADGVGAVSTLLEQAPGVPIVVLTGLDDDSTALEALRLGAQDFLVKERVNGPALWRVVNYAAQRHAAMAQLRRSEMRFARAFQAAPYGMAIISAADRPGVFVQVNDALCSMLGRAPGDLVGRAFREVTHPDDLEHCDAAFESITAESLSQIELEKRYLHADGSTVHAIVTASLMEEHDGSPAYVITQMRDITEKVRAKHENARLEQILQQTQRMETVGQLAGGVAHDFNNLLSVIRNYTQFAIEELGDHAVVDDLTQVVHAADRAASLTQQLLVFGRRDRAQPSVIDLSETVTDAAPLLRRTVSEDIDLVVDCGGALAVLIDRSQLDQVVLNLVVNARDAMPGGGRIRLSTARSSVDGDPVAVLAVEDSGCGMTPELQARIFDPFFTTKDASGTGLGLATVYGIVTRAGGTIDVDTEVDRGTTFRICLPIAVAQDATGPAEPPPADLSRPATVLVVEDEGAVRQLTARILTRAGYEVHAAENGEHALELLEELDAPPDAVVTDVVMPRLGGAALHERLARDHPTVGVVFVSGYTARPDQLPPDARLVAKPLVPEVLLAHVAALVAERRQ